MKTFKACTKCNGKYNSKQFNEGEHICCFCKNDFAIQGLKNRLQIVYRKLIGICKELKCNNAN